MFEKGGAKPSDVEHLVQQSHQLLWAYEEVQKGVPELVARLKEAQAWAQKASNPSLGLLPVMQWKLESVNSIFFQAFGAS